MSAYTSEDLVSTISSNVTQITPTATSADERAALTTPYIPPSNCTPNWKKTSLIWTQDGTFTYPVLVSAPPASCYPSGWEISEAQSLFTFSPALSQQHTAAKGSASKHLAPPLESRLIRSFSGFTFDPYDRGGYVANDFFTRGCGRWVQTISDISQRDGTTTTTLSASSNYQDASAMDDTFMVHQAWEISWGSSERSDLTPMPLTRPTESFDQSQGYISTSAVWFLMVGLPIIVFLMIVGCCWVCIRRRIRERRVRRAMRDSSLPQTGEGRSSLTLIS
ncbi:uncharacterized protein FOBCDRAFT_238543 [Fusarium oxysporum Fo47]|uniref:uncharacterized protein n=1 Tax=Fusarium oxysporum Fo47 TaxID=660027 RepID=UPI002869833E|nr:uncharacterized protein FOBCDRAFT_238543 [Fusarium oxysporum Fo47]QKD52242.2 hypothetical protein FOBCDRAFT_238543 [Fusarium oxysporum Fo47]